MAEESLEDLIRAAFAEVPAPPLWCLTGSREGTEPALLERDFRDKRDWSLLASEFLDWAPDGFGSALSFFSDEAFRFYLPAYLIADIRGQLTRVDVLFHLVHGFDNESMAQLVNPRRYGSRTWNDVARHKFSVFSSEQARAIAAYLVYRRDTATISLDREQAQQALERYWEARL